MAQYDIKIPTDASTREIFFDRNSGKLSYKNDNGIVTPLESSSAGTLIGPVSSTNNAIPRFNGTTGAILKNSGVTIDDNNNITTNNLFDGFTSIAASGTLITLTVASTPSYLVTGSGGQTIQLPDATTLPKGAFYNFNNNQSSGALSVNNHSTTLVKSVPSGGNMILELVDNSIAAGSWDAHFQAPSNVFWSTNTFDYTGSITGATWNAVAIADAKIASAATWNAKQAALVSGTNIKTVNNNSVLGSGNLAISALPHMAYGSAGYSYTNSITGGGITYATQNTVAGTGGLTPFTPLISFTTSSFSILSNAYSGLVGGNIVIYSSSIGQQIGGNISKQSQYTLNMTAAASIYTVTASFVFAAGVTYWIGWIPYTVISGGASVHVCDPKVMLPISSPVSTTQNIGYTLTGMSSALPNFLDLSTYTQSAASNLYQVWFNVASIP